MCLVILWPTTWVTESYSASGADVSCRLQQGSTKLPVHSGAMPRVCRATFLGDPDILGFDAFCPLGPALVSTRALPDPSVLKLKTTVNGNLKQDGAADLMIFSIGQYVALVFSSLN